MKERTQVAFECTIPAVPTLQRDDATVRITTWRFEPGAVTGWHEHGWPYFVVMLTPGILRVHNGAEVSETTLGEGESYMRPAGIRHDVMNGSDHPIAFTEIEVKQPGELAKLMLP